MIRETTPTPGEGPVVSDLLAAVPGLRHGFGSRAEPIALPLSEAGWEARKPGWRQVHGVDIAHVAAAGQACGDVDALYTRQPCQPIAVVTADCVPVLLSRRDGGAAAAVHAGWRGTRARILRALWARLAGEGERAADWVAAVGPAIGPCCYEVSEVLARDFTHEFGAAATPVAERPRYLDLPGVNARELVALGVGEVEVLRACTRCALTGAGAPRFHSYRREGRGVRQWSALVTGD